MGRKSIVLFNGKATSWPQQTLASFVQLCSLLNT